MHGQVLTGGKEEASWRNGRDDKETMMTESNNHKREETENEQQPGR